MKRLLRVGLGIGGLGLLAALLLQADWPAVLETLARVGWLAPLALLPYLAVYLIDTAAWATLLPVRPRPSFGTLFRVRWAGEAVNNLVPTGYIGGEAVKVYLLRRHGVPAGDGTVAALVSKTAQTLAQVAFVMLGALLFARLTPGEGAMPKAMMGIAAGGFLAILVLVWIQRRGLLVSAHGVLDRWRLRFAWLERKRDRLATVDRQIRDFYDHHRRRFLLGTGLFLAGWLTDAVEIYLLGRFMQVPIDWSHALAIEAFIGVAKVVGLLVPGAVGVQESGVVWLCRLAGLPEPFGFAYAMWRRVRELLYAGIGWALLTAERADLRQIREADAAAAAKG